MKNAKLLFHARCSGYDRMETVPRNEVLQMQEAALNLRDHGWAKGSSGNISIRLSTPFSGDPGKLYYNAPLKVPELEGSHILITRAGSTMEEVIGDPEGSIGLFGYHEGKLDLVWGSGPPTSELSSHLLILSMKKGNVVMHCHMDAVLRFSSNHPGGRTLPGGFGSVGWFEPGSPELAFATMNAMKEHNTVLWMGHGAISCAGSVDECIGNLLELERELEEILDG